jgi:predicted RNA methylase
MLKYNNSDSKSLGIVLTPNDTVEFMVYLAKLNKNDIFLDLCCGTSSFICEALKYNINVIGCELQERLYYMTLCNLIIRKKLYASTITKGDCFLQTFSATKSVINPPFSMKNKEYKELNFVKKQLESLTNKGLAISIFPISCLNASEKIYKKQITDLGKIKTIIILNSKVFYPSASVSCCILVVEKGKEHDFENDKVKIINFENDGYNIEKQKGRVKMLNYLEITQAIHNEINGISQSIHKTLNTLINLEDDWNFSFYNNPKIELTIADVKNKMVSLEITKLTKFNLQNQDNTVINFPKIKEFFIKDLFIIKKGKNIIKSSLDGLVPLISSSSNCNGICKYIKNSVYSSGGLTLTKNGNVGDCFFQPFPFDATSDVYILEPKCHEIQNEKIGVYFASLIQKSLSNKYNWSYKLNDMRINREIINLPVKNNDIDFEFISKLHFF